MSEVTQGKERWGKRTQTGRTTEKESAPRPQKCALMFLENNLEKQQKRTTNHERGEAMSLSRNREVVKAENVQGGEGYILRDLLLQGEQLHGKLTYASTITLEPGCSIGTHTHTGDSEMYFIYEGTGTYVDNDDSYPVQADDVLFCRDGETHGLMNDGSDPLRFVAVMQASE